MQYLVNHKYYLSDILNYFSIKKIIDCIYGN